MFLDDTERALHPDWDAEAGAMVAEFRASVGTDLTDPRVVALSGELSAASEAFRAAWQRHDVDLLTGAVTRWSHPTAGPLTLRRGNYPITGTNGAMLVVHYAAAGSVDAERLARLTR